MPRFDLCADASQDQRALQAVGTRLLLGGTAPGFVAAHLHRHFFASGSRTHQRRSLRHFRFHRPAAVDIFFQRSLGRHDRTSRAFQPDVESVFSPRDSALIVRACSPARFFDRLRGANGPDAVLRNSPDGQRTLGSSGHGYLDCISDRHNAVRVSHANPFPGCRSCDAADIAGLDVCHAGRLFATICAGSVPALVRPQSAGWDYGDFSERASQPRHSGYHIAVRMPAPIAYHCSRLLCLVQTCRSHPRGCDLTMYDVEFQNVSKRYPRQPLEDQSASGSGKFFSWARRGRDFWARRGVSFHVERGEALGIIGHNGAGKTTILKLLSRITAPTSGEITICGRLSSLIEVSSGFHAELTGRENVYLSGVTFGMSRKEVYAKLPSILEFSGIGDFIDVPVKRYSTGMYLRLGFSIAAHLDPDILLLDEVLAVGDATFQAKCLDRVTELKRAGTTIVFISHNLHAVARLCERTLLLSRGEILSDGPTNDVIAEYERRLSSLTPSTPHGEPLITDPRAVEIISLSFYDSQNRKTTSFQTGESLRAVIEYKVNEPIEDAIVEVYFYSIFGNMHCHFTTAAKGERLSLTHGVGAVEFFCAAVALEAATFNVDVGVKRTGSLSSEFVDCKRAAVLNVTVGRPVLGVFYMPHTWTMRNTDSSNQQHGVNTIYEILPLKN